MLSAQNYSASVATVDGVEIIRLTDSHSHTEVNVVPSVGNMAYDMKVNGHAIFWSPEKNAAGLKARPAFAGVPFLSPWANRLDQDAFWANNHLFHLNAELKNLRRDQNNHPIHGLVAFTDEWKIIAHGGDSASAWASARLEFWRNPRWMAQFPFAHAIEMTYRLKDGALEVHTVYENLADEPMPLVIGYHPYFTLPGTARDDWQVHLAARDHVKLNAALTPTGERTPVDKGDFGLRGRQLDDVYDNLVRDSHGNAEFSFAAGSRKITIVYGPKYNTAVVYAPPGRDFICFEPMTGITNGANLAHDGKYSGLQTIPARGRWEESFWIRPTGFEK